MSGLDTSMWTRKKVTNKKIHFEGGDWLGKKKKIGRDNCG